MDANGITTTAISIDWTKLAPVITFAALFITLSILTIGSNTLALALFDKIRNKNYESEEKLAQLYSLESKLSWLQVIIFLLFTSITIIGFGILLLHSSKFFIEFSKKIPLQDWILGTVIGYCLFMVCSLLYIKLKYENTIRGID